MSERKGRFPIPEIALIEDVPSRLDAVVRIYDRYLDHGNLPIDEQIKLCRGLRSLTTHPDTYVRRLADEALDKRWAQVGFYLPVRRMRQSFLSETKRDHWNEVDHIDEPTKLLILELARHYASSDGRLVKEEDLHDLLYPLVGPELKGGTFRDTCNIYVLTDDAEFVPLLLRRRNSLGLTRPGYKHIAPHLPILEAISYPANVVNKEDLKASKEVGVAAEKTYEAAKELLLDDSYASLHPKRDHDLVIPSVSSLDDYLGRKKDWADPREDYPTIRYRRDGKLYEISYYGGSFGQHDVSFSVTIPSYMTREQFIRDFWGKYIKGGEFEGSIGVGPKGFRVRGSYLQLFPGSLGQADEVAIAQERMSVHWNDVSEGIAKEDPNFPYNNVYVKVVYELPFKAEYFLDHLKKYTFLTPFPVKMEIPVSNPDYRPKKQHKKGSFDTGTYDWRNTETIAKEISFEKPEEIITVSYPGGDYTVAYKREEDQIKVDFLGNEWQKTIVLPSNLDAVSISRQLGHEVMAIVDYIKTHEDEISSQVSNTRRLGLAEQVLFAEMRSRIENFDLDNEFIQRKFAEPRFTIFHRADFALSQLDEETQWILRTYLQSLGEDVARTQRMLHDNNESRIYYEDTPESMRRIIEKHKLPIPLDVLELCEEAFLAMMKRDES